ncbi:lamin tail domain-containing protein [Streptomyces sp. NPDC048191]|uniref:lamin tail domain-containing protein n=1 Tax=Streptomyces sp. NPDC048191 TaxID=3155484 RepID=UPI0033F16ABD
MSVSSSVRRATAVAAVAAATVGAVALPAAASDHQPGHMRHGVVYISGVQHAWQDRGDRSNRSLNRQWVDVTNSSRRAMNLDSWTLSDRNGHTYTFHHTLLRGRATVRVHTGFGRDTRTDVYQDRRARVWDVNADTAILRDDRGRLVDSFSWSQSHRNEGAGRHHAGYPHGAWHVHHGDHVRGRLH